MATDAQAAVNVAFEFDEDGRTGFEPTFDEIDEGIYTDAPMAESQATGAEPPGDVGEEDTARCSRCLSCLRTTRREIVSTANEMVDLVRKECGPPKDGWKSCAWKFFQNRFPCLRWMPKYK